MNRRLLIPASALAAMTLAITGCSSTSDTTPADTAASEASTDAGAEATDLAATTSEEWLAAVTSSEASFFDAGQAQALQVVVTVTDSVEGGATADSTYNPDDTFVGSSTLTSADGTESTLRVACTATMCFRSEEGAPWEEADRALIERPAPGAVGAAVQNLESVGTVTYSTNGNDFAASVVIPEAEGQAAGTAELTETVGESEITTTMTVTSGENTNTTVSTITYGDAAPLPTDLP